MVNEDLSLESHEVLTSLQRLIGPYYLYIQEETTGYNNDDPNVVKEEFM